MVAPVAGPRVGLGGLGSIGRTLAEQLVAGFHGYELGAVSARRSHRAAEFVASLGSHAPVVAIEEIADHAEVVVEALPANCFRSLVEPAIDRGRLVVVLSAGALLEHDDLIDLAARRGAQLHVPSGALMGLDAMQAAALGDIRSATMVTRKPVASLADAPRLERLGVAVEEITESRLLFEGTARQAIVDFPANLNVAVALSLACGDPDLVRLQVWADPALEHNTHHVEVDADSAQFEFTIRNVPSEKPGTGRITALSVLALLAKLARSLRIGT